MKEMNNTGDDRFREELARSLNLSSDISQPETQAAEPDLNEPESRRRQTDRTKPRRTQGKPNVTVEDCLRGPFKKDFNVRGDSSFREEIRRRIRSLSNAGVDDAPSDFSDVVRAAVASALVEGREPREVEPPVAGEAFEQKIKVNGAFMSLWEWRDLPDKKRKPWLTKTLIEYVNRNLVVSPK